MEYKNEDKILVNNVPVSAVRGDDGIMKIASSLKEDQVRTIVGEMINDWAQTNMIDWDAKRIEAPDPVESPDEYDAFIKTLFIQAMVIGKDAANLDEDGYPEVDENGNVIIQNQKGVVLGNFDVDDLFTMLGVERVTEMFRGASDAAKSAKASEERAIEAEENASASASEARASADSASTSASEASAKAEELKGAIDGAEASANAALDSANKASASASEARASADEVQEILEGMKIDPPVMVIEDEESETIFPEVPYDRETIDSMLDAKADRLEVFDALKEKADKESVYTKEEAEERFITSDEFNLSLEELGLSDYLKKAEAEATYDTITSVDSKLALKADKTSLVGLATETFVTSEIEASKPDLTPYALKENVDASLAEKVNTSDFEEYKTAVTAEIEASKPDLTPYAKVADVNSELTKKADKESVYTKTETYTREEVNSLIEKTVTEGVDLSAYAKSEALNALDLREAGHYESLDERLNAVYTSSVIDEKLKALEARLKKASTPQIQSSYEG